MRAGSVGFLMATNQLKDTRDEWPGPTRARGQLVPGRITRRLRREKKLHGPESLGPNVTG
jgi:hypothetical protein